MGAKLSAYEAQSKNLKSEYKCNKTSDAKRFINRYLNYLENKAINNLTLSIECNYNDKSWSEYFTENEEIYEVERRK